VRAFRIYDKSFSGKTALPNRGGVRMFQIEDDSLAAVESAR